MSRIRIITISLLFVLLVGIGFAGGAVFAFNPQPEPPAKPQINKLKAMTKQLEGLNMQLENIVDNLADDPDVSEALQGVGQAAMNIALTAGY